MSTVSAGNFGPGAFGVGDEEESGPSGGVAGALTLFVLAIAAVAMWQGADAQRVLLTASLSLSFFGLINFSPPAGISATIFYLCILGGLRRYMLPILGYSSLDALLLVAPIIVVLFFINRMLRRDIPRDTRLSKLTFWFMIILLLEIVNPLQGGLMVGVTSAMYYVVPVMWFYVGRSFGSNETLKAFFNTVLVASALGVIYAMYQQFVGFTEVERQWIAITKNDGGLYLVGTHRVFSFFPSFSEYAHFVIFGVVLSLVGTLKRNRSMVILYVLFFMALVLTSSRGALLTGVACSVLVWAVQGKSFRSWAPRLVIAAVIGLSALVFGLTTAKEANLDPTAEALVDHQARGLLAPLERKRSTGDDHVQQVVKAIVIGIRYPFGNGLGMTTIAGGKVSGGDTGIRGEGFGAESDIGNVFISCGAIGGVLYVFLIGTAFWRAARRWYFERDEISLATLIMMFASVNFWLMGSHYAETTTIWFILGSLDRYDHYQHLKEYAAALKERAKQGGNRLAPIKPVSRRMK